MASAKIISTVAIIAASAIAIVVVKGACSPRAGKAAGSPLSIETPPATPAAQAQSGPVAVSRYVGLWTYVSGIAKSDWVMPSSAGPKNEAPIAGKSFSIVQSNGELWVDSNSTCKYMMAERGGHLELTGREECAKSDSNRPKTKHTKFQFSLGPDGLASVESESTLTVTLEGALKEGKVTISGRAKKSDLPSTAASNGSP